MWVQIGVKVNVVVGNDADQSTLVLAAFLGTEEILTILRFETSQIVAKVRYAFMWMYQGKTTANSLYQEITPSNFVILITAGK